jgi:hypothetical protein
VGLVREHGKGLDLSRYDVGVRALDTAFPPPKKARPLEML